MHITPAQPSRHVVAMCAIAAGHAVGRMLADRAPQRLAGICQDGAISYIAARGIGFDHESASDRRRFPSPLSNATPGTFVEVSIDVAEAGAMWHIEIAEITASTVKPSGLALSPRRRLLAAIEQQDTIEPDALGDPDAPDAFAPYIMGGPLPAALLAALPGYFAALAH